MVRVVFFDLSRALVDRNNRPYPYVADALATIARFETTAAKPLATALVSDVDRLVPATTRVKTSAVFERYLEILDRSGLRLFFEPVERRVTLSVHAEAMLPDRALFRTALKRLRLTASLGDCVLVTAHTGHVRAVRRVLKMRALCFGTVPASGVDFSDWRQAPALVGRMVDDGAGANTLVAVRRFLHVAHAFDAESIDVRNRGHRLSASGTCWAPVIDQPEAGGPLFAPFPSTCVVSRRTNGEMTGIDVAQPSAAERSEAANFVRSVLRHGQIGAVRGRVGSAATHAIEVDDQGRRKLVRKRFSGI